MKYILLILMAFVMAACASRSLTPEVNDVEMSRKDPPKDCTELGKVTGRTMTAKGKPDEALADMRKEAAAKGATFVKIEQYGASGTTVTGMAFNCK